MVHRYVRDNSHRLIIHVNFMVKCVCCYMGIGSNGWIVTGVALTVDHYMTYIIKSVGYPRLESVRLLVVAYNGRGIGIILQVSQDNVNPVRN
jgi:hypothetical protein